MAHPHLAQPGKACRPFGVCRLSKGHRLSPALLFAALVLLAVPIHATPFAGLTFTASQYQSDYYYDFRTWSIALDSGAIYQDEMLLGTAAWTGGTNPYQWTVRA